MADVMMKLGAYTFSVDTAAYQQFRRSTEYRWPVQERVGNHDALQFTGAGAETISLTGDIYPHFRGGIGQINAMREEAGAGQPLLLVDGLGNVHGRWVIERVEETQDRFFTAGVPRRQRFSLQLRKYDNGDNAGILLAESSFAVNDFGNNV